MTLLILLLSITAKADWFCTEASSVRNGNVINACGIGLGTDENEARANAFNNAKAEFKRICDVSNDCRGRRIVVNPMRTQCDNVRPYKCYRMVSFTIGKGSSPSEAKPPNGEIDSNELSRPIAKIGMSKQEFLEKFGEPKSANKDWLLGLVFIYDGSPYCDNGYCQVSFKNDKLSSVYKFKIKYTEELK